eukprot:6206626-Pleurochrysis_carterae.AAC.1
MDKEKAVPQPARRQAGDGLMQTEILGDCSLVLEIVWEVRGSANADRDYQRLLLSTRDCSGKCVAHARSSKRRADERPGACALAAMDTAVLSPSNRGRASPTVQDQPRRSPRLLPVLERNASSSDQQPKGRGRGCSPGRGRAAATYKTALWDRDIVKRRLSNTSARDAGWARSSGSGRGASRSGREDEHAPELADIERERVRKQKPQAGVCGRNLAARKQVETAVLRQKRVKEFSDQSLAVRNGELFCKACCENIRNVKATIDHRHVAGSTHAAKLVQFVLKATEDM